MGTNAYINGSINIYISTGFSMACIILLQANCRGYRSYKYRLYSQANCSDTIAFFLVGKRVCISVGCTVPKEKLPFANVNIIQVFYRCKWNAKNIIGKNFFQLGCIGVNLIDYFNQYYCDSG